MRKKISLDEPIAFVGDVVEVLNYRKKTPTWERGICREVEFKMNYFTGADPEKATWHYRVCLDRRAKGGSSIFLATSEASIRRCTEVEG